jgi:hypothetical protein
LARLAPDEAGAGFERAPRALPAVPKRTDFPRRNNQWCGDEDGSSPCGSVWWQGRRACRDNREGLLRRRQGRDAALLRKLDSGEIPLPVMRMEKSQKGARLISLQDLAAFLDERRADAQKELQQMTA